MLNLRNAGLSRLAQSIASALLLVALASCSNAADEPAQLPFVDENTSIPGEVGTSDETSSEGTDSGSSTDAERADVSDVFAGIDRDPAVADCQDAIFDKAGISTVGDLSDFAQQSAKLSEADQQALADCVNGR